MSKDSSIRNSNRLLLNHSKVQLRLSCEAGTTAEHSIARSARIARRPGGVGEPFASMRVEAHGESRPLSSEVAFLAAR